MKYLSIGISLLLLAFLIYQVNKEYGFEMRLRIHNYLEYQKGRWGFPY